MDLSPKPTGAELAILSILWKRGPLTVKEVHAGLGEGTGYTTTLKLLQIMTEKGLVTRDETRRAHVYRARREAGETQRQLVASLVEKAFRGSVSQLVLQALSVKRASPKELAEIKQLVDRMAREKK